MGPEEFIAVLRKSGLAPAYFHCGSDRFLHQECRDAVRAAVPEDSRAWCLAEIEYQPGQLARELQAALQIPMLGGHSYFLISDTNDFKHADEDDAKALAAYLENPSRFATLIFSAFEPDRRRKFIQLLEKKTTVVEMRALSVRQAAAWAKEFLHRSGIEIDAGLAEEIAAKFAPGSSSRDPNPQGVNLLWMRTELEKLITAADGKARLEPPDLQLISTFQEEHEIGRMLRAIAERQCGDALAFLRSLVASKVAETLLVWCIGDLFRHALKSSGQSSYGGGWGRQSNPFAPWEIAPLARRRYSHEEMLKALTLVHQADLGIKSSWKDSTIMLEILIWRVTSAAATSGGRSC
ncbi:MAG: DNA polymerase III subunit delta [Acidobacteria bacterium]|nr:MAG: DNA polymerase III subunit delta [Acidobacteriota bacterium]